MGIDAEDVIVYLWRFLKFFINTTYVCVEKHPFASCAVLVSFLVYVFFDVLLYHLPFLVFVAILLRIFWSSERQQDDNRTNEPQPEDRRKVDDREMPPFQRQKSRRTQFSKDRAFHGNDTKSAVAREVVEGGIRDSDEEEEEEEKVSNNKAVEWNEDDQKNVDDLGISEIERNRRLESLIAKRRARKKEKLCTTISDPSPGFQLQQKVAAVATKTNPFEDEDGEDYLEGPGSAPSVLFPGKNPFDIPYDQMEEKPDLTVDSFQEEFSVADQKDSFMYCRHESFCYGSFFDSQLESARERHEAKLSAFFGTHRRGFARPSGNDRLVDQLLGGTKAGADINGTASSAGSQQDSTKTLADSETSKPRDTQQSISETTSSSSFEVSNRSVDDGSSVPPGSVDPHYDTSPTSNGKNRSSVDRVFLGDKLAIHTPSYSIASDLQVEVSEIGSPPLTMGNVTPNDVDSLSCDEEIEHAHLSFDMESLDDINQALEKVGKMRETSNSEEPTTMQLARQLSSHPFFESVFGTTEETNIPPDESAEENTIEDSGNDFTDDLEDKEKQNNDEDDEITMTVQPEETDIESNSQSLDQNQPEETGLNNNNTNNESNDVVEDNSHEEEVLKLEEENQDSAAESEQESLVEEVDVNPSSPSSPRSTPTCQIRTDLAFSSALNQTKQKTDAKSDIEQVVTSSLIDEQSTDDGTSSVSLALDSKCHESHSTDSEALQEKLEFKIDEPSMED